MREAESDAYDELLSYLENWTEELATRGPRALPEIYREMAQTIEPRNDREREQEPCIDFNHQKGYK